MIVVRSILGRLFGGEQGDAPEDAREDPGAQPDHEYELEPGTSSRREFLARFGAGLAGVAAVLAGIPIVGSFLTTPDRRERSWQAVGPLEDFPVAETVRVEFTDPDALPWAGPAATNAAWVRRLSEDEFAAFSVFCTHTGCPVDWHGGANLFVCPCHGGVFDREGDVIGGPPESPLIRLEVRVREQQVEVLAAPIPVSGNNSRRTQARRRRDRKDAG